MGSYIYLILMIVMIYMIYRNYGLAKRSKHTKNYIACANAIFDKDENTINIIDEYLLNENSEEFKNKAKVLKIYAECRYNLDPRVTIEELNLYDTLYTKNKFDLKKFEYNSDTYFWLILDEVKLFTINNIDALEALKNKLDLYKDDIKNDIAIKLFYSIYDLFKNENDKDLEFFHQLIDGEYQEYSYDKRLIGFYKHIANLMLRYANDDSANIDDLKAFAQMKAGKIIMSDLSLLNEYEEKEEEIDEDIKEDN